MNELHRVEIRYPNPDEEVKQISLKVDGMEIRNLKSIDLALPRWPGGEPLPVVTISFYAELT